MIKNKKSILIICIILVICIIGICIYFNNLNNKENVKNEKFEIVTTFFPVELIINNIVYNAKDVEINNITKSVGGCVHDYELTPNDVKIIEKADVFIINGADMEHFIENINFKNISIIDSSVNISDTKTSSHIWMNLNNYIEQIKTITNKLCEYNQSNKDVYILNMNTYIKKIEQLKIKYDEIQNINTNVAIMHDSFNYYKDKFNITASLISGHEGNTSANEIKEFIEKINNTSTRVLLVDSETFEENNELISNVLSETNTEVFVIDLIVKNDLENSLDTYINIMEHNIDILKDAINYGK